MVRGLYTGASGMIAQMGKINVLSNNLANVNTPSYKKDTTILKAFPEMLIRRIKRTTKTRNIRNSIFGMVSD